MFMPWNPWVWFLRETFHDYPIALSIIRDTAMTPSLGGPAQWPRLLGALRDALLYNFRDNLTRQQHTQDQHAIRKYSPLGWNLLMSLNHFALKFILLLMNSNSGIPVCGKYCRVPGTVLFHGKLVPIFAAPVHPNISNIQDTTRALH